MSMFSQNRVAARMQQRKHDRELQAQFDAMSAADAAGAIEFDPINERMAVHANVQMRLAALQVALMTAAIINESDEESDMLPSEVLDDLMISVFVEDDEDDDDDIDPTAKATLAAHISDALATLGVDDATIEDMFSDDVDVADAAIEEASEVVIENMPDDDSFDEFVQAFAYGLEEDDESYDGMNEGAYDDEESQFDGGRTKTPLTAGKKTKRKVNGKTIVYKAVKAIRDGKKVVINKRVSGTIKLTPAQKAALRKARKKSKTASSVKKRMMSFAKGLGKNIYNIPPERAKKMRATIKANHFKRSTGRA